METLQYKDLTVKIWHDEYADYFDDDFTNPEPFHTFGSWNGYSLFETEGKGPEWLQHVLDTYYHDILKSYKGFEYSSCLEDYDPEYNDAPYSYTKAERLLTSWIDKNLIVLPVYVYEHSGITMSTGSFSCPWDSGQAGFIYMSKKEAREAGYRTDKRAEEAMRARIEYLAAICEGEVYGYSVEDEDGDVLESCGGYVETEYSLEKMCVYHDAMAAAEACYKDRLKKHIERKKTEIKNHVPLLARLNEQIV